ncbi:hypothetical protein NL676_024541 [Syzygium grande]|nr:hypothetical protein NL676_024541 [Syzygium grande]
MGEGMSANVSRVAAPGCKALLSPTPEREQPGAARTRGRRGSLPCGPRGSGWARQVAGPDWLCSSALHALHCTGPTTHAAAQRAAATDRCRSTGLPPPSEERREKSEPVPKVRGGFVVLLAVLAKKHKKVHLRAHKHTPSGFFSFPAFLETPASRGSRGLIIHFSPFQFPLRFPGKLLNSLRSLFRFLGRFPAFLLSSRGCPPEQSPSLFLRFGIPRVMEQFHNDDLEYVVDDYFDEFYDDDNPFSDVESPGSTDVESVDSDFEDDFESNKPKTDTSALEARNGKDMQGIPWERMNYTRDKYREKRLKQYKNYESLSRSRVELDKECLQVEKGKNFYDFPI